MIDRVNSLIAALREELTHYGEMLALLDQQQDLIVARAAHELIQVSSSVQAQADAVLSSRRNREDLRRAAASELGLDENGSFADLIAVLPSDYRPLIEALVHENNQLLLRIQQRTRQNHLLLSRSLELTQRLMNTLLPSREVTVYNGRGGAASAKLPMQALYEAVG